MSQTCASYKFKSPKILLKRTPKHLPVTEVRSPTHARHATFYQSIFVNTNNHLFRVGGGDVNILPMPT